MTGKTLFLAVKPDSCILHLDSGKTHQQEDLFDLLLI